MRPIGTPEELEHRRLRALVLLSQGKLPSEVAKLVGVDRRSVRRWKATIRKDGERGLRARPASGRPPKLKAKDRRKLESLLLKGPLAAGFGTDLWTCPRVAELIEQRFAVQYHVDHVGRLLHDLGWSPQKPTRRAIERDEQEIRRWVREDWQRVKKNARRRRAAIVFIDETGFLMGPLVRRSWAPRGQTPVLMQRGRARSKVSAIGALVVSPRRHRVRSYFSLLANANFDGDSVLVFLKQLCRALRVPIELVWDRSQAHRGQPVKAWLERNTHRIRTTLLPAYAPELNPVELIWGHLKTNPLANFAPVELDQLIDQAHLATLAISRDTALLRSFIHHCPISFCLK